MLIVFNIWGKKCNIVVVMKKNKDSVYANQNHFVLHKVALKVNDKDNITKKGFSL